MKQRILVLLLFIIPFIGVSQYSFYTQSQIIIDHYRIRNALNYNNIPQNPSLQLCALLGVQFPATYKKKNIPEFTQCRIGTGFTFGQRYGIVRQYNGKSINTFGTYWDIPIVFDIKAGSMLHEGLPVKFGVSIGYCLSIPATAIYFSENILPPNYNLTLTHKEYGMQGFLFSMKAIWMGTPYGEIELGFRMRGDIGYLWKSEKLNDIIVPQYVGYGTYIAFTRYFQKREK